MLEGESVVVTQKVAPIHLITTAEQVENKVSNQIKVSIICILPQVHITLPIALCLSSLPKSLMVFLHVILFFRLQALRK